jgi:hypothetical protein
MCWVVAMLVVRVTLQAEIIVLAVVACDELVLR